MRKSNKWLEGMEKQLTNFHDVNPASHNAIVSEFKIKTKQISSRNHDYHHIYLVGEVSIFEKSNLSMKAVKQNPQYQKLLMGVATGNKINNGNKTDN